MATRRKKATPKKKATQKLGAWVDQDSRILSEHLEPCAEGLAFARKFPNVRAAWKACSNPGWMVWYLDDVFDGEDNPVLKRHPLHDVINRIVYEAIDDRTLSDQQICNVIRVLIPDPTKGWEE